MNKNTQHFLLTKITPVIITGIVMTLVWNGVGMPYIQGADGQFAKIVDDEFCRVGAFITDEHATADERSGWCTDAKKILDDTAIFGFLIMSVIGMLIMRSIVKPVEEWGKETETRSAI